MVAEKLAKFQAQKEAEIKKKRGIRVICPMCGALNDGTHAYCVTCHSKLK